MKNKRKILEAVKRVLKAREDGDNFETRYPGALPSSINPHQYIFISPKDYDLLKPYFNYRYNFEILDENDELFYSTEGVIVQGEISPKKKSGEQEHYIGIFDAEALYQFEWGVYTMLLMNL